MNRVYPSGSMNVLSRFPDYLPAGLWDVLCVKGGLQLDDGTRGELPECQTLRWCQDSTATYTEIQPLILRYLVLATVIRCTPWLLIQTVMVFRPVDAEMSLNRSARCSGCVDRLINWPIVVLLRCYVNCTILWYLCFIVHFRGTYCTFYSTTFIWKL